VRRTATVTAVLLIAAAGFHFQVLGSEAGETVDWVPFVARKTGKVLERGADGMVKTAQETVGTYQRNRQGSIFTRDLSVAGREPSANAEGILQDARTGVIYRIDFENKRAFAVKGPDHAGPAKPTTEEEFRRLHPPERFLAKKKVSGVECEEYSVPGENPADPDAIMCFAPSLNFFAVQARFPEPEYNAEVLVEFLDIEVGREPDPQFFGIPSDFEVIQSVQ
jgi:hypothetical protein